MSGAEILMVFWNAIWNIGVKQILLFKWVPGLFRAMGRLLFGDRFSRVRRDERKLLRILPRIQTLMRTLRTRHVNVTPTPELGARLLEAVVCAAQPIITEFAGEALLSVKLVNDASATHFTCIYPTVEVIPPKFLAFIRQLNQIPIIPSYAGLAQSERRTIIEPDLSKQLERIHFPDEVQRALSDHKIAGLVVHPVFVPEQTDPVAVLKIDFLRKNGMVDNGPTKTMLSLVEEFVGYALQVLIEGCPQNAIDVTGTKDVDVPDAAKPQGGN